MVIVGGGFGGLTAARGLRRAPVQVTVVDRQNHHLFQPLLYQVATAGLSPGDIASPIRRILSGQKNAEVLLGEVAGIDGESRQVSTADGQTIAFDYLILATGATHSYFGHDDWEQQAPGLKTIEEALEIRRRVLLAFEEAERAADPEARKDWLTFAVIGGGPTGVEMAGALAEIARHTLAGDFRHFDPAVARIVLLEASPRILQPYPEELSQAALRQLETLGVEVRTGVKVTNIDERGLEVGDRRLPARTVVWAAGVQPSPLARALGVELERGQVPVEPDLTVPGHPRVFVIGDLARVEQDGRPVPGVAPAAMQMGDHAADNVVRSLRGEPTRPFRYRDKGSLATVGRRRAVAVFGRLRLAGTIAWLAWLAIHIFFLIGFRNRFVVLFNWAWAYVTYQRTARLILSYGRASTPNNEAGPGEG